MKNFKVIGIGATKLVGKDTLFTILNNIFPGKLERVGLADILKAECDEFCLKHYGISAFTKIPSEKEILRYCFLSHGKIKRLLTKGTYWTGLIQERVDDIINDGLIPVCTDIRYAQYPEDEIFWLKNKNDGIYIHINRFNSDGSRIESNIKDEIEQEKILEKHADFRLNWQTSADKTYLEDTVKIQLKDLISGIKTKYGIV